MVLEIRSGIRPHTTETTDAAWDAAAAERNLREDEDADYYAQAYAWRDDGEDGTAKSHYAFIHHVVAADGAIGAANITACFTGIGVLNGGRMRPGTRPRWAGDRQAIWRHLARHMEDAGREPPPLRERSLWSGMERRTVDMRARVRAGQEGLRIIQGHAAVFDSLSQPLPFLGGIRERIRPGAFAKTVKEADIRALWNHNPDYVLGRTKSGTLRVWEDEVGLAFQVEPPDAEWARALMASIARGDVDQASFGFQVVREAMVTEGGEPVREIQEVRLYDVSPVTFPAYTETSVQARHWLLDAVANWTVYDNLIEALRAEQPPGTPGPSPISRDREALERAARERIMWLLRQQSMEV